MKWITKRAAWLWRDILDCLLEDIDDIKKGVRQCLRVFKGVR
jgi:hypothetical protein